MRQIFSLLVIQILTILYCSAQITSTDLYQYRLSNYTIEDGMSNNKVNAVCGDENGFIWFGTNEGVNKFDGYTSEIFKNDPEDASSISHSVIRSIFTDSKNRVWIGTQNGLNLYNPSLNNFIRINDDSRLSVGLVWSICEDNRGVVWFGGREGLFYIDSESLALKNFSELNTWFKPTEISEVFAGSDNVLLIGAKYEGLFLYHYLDGNYSAYESLSDDYTTISETWIESFYEDSLGNFWIGTSNSGLNYFNYRNKSFTRYELDSAIPENRRIRDIVEDKYGRLWLGTHDGLYLKNSDDSFIRFAHKNHDISKLSNNSIYDIYIDDNDILWMGTYAGGVNFTDFNQKQFMHFYAKSDNNKFLNDNIVYAIASDENSNLWIGTEKGGINVFDRDKRVYQYFTHDPENPNTIASNNIKSMVFDANNNVWIGTYKGGLSFYNRKERSFTNFVHDPNQKTGIISNTIYVLLFDTKRNLWIGTDTGLDLLKRGTSEFLHYTNQSGENFGFEDDIIRSLYQDSRGDIWAGTNHIGVYKLDKTKNTFLPYKPGIIDMGVFTICEDKNGMLWMGGNNGLFYIDTQLDSIVYFSEKEGLPAKTVYRVIDDNEGNIWLSTTNGISKFINGVYSPNVPRFKNYDTDDGLQSRHFMYNSYNKFDSGEIMFGGVNGFNIFYPNQINNNPLKPKVLINGLKIFNKPVRVDEEIKGVSVLDSSLLVSDELSLSYKHYVFSIGFVALHMAQADKNRFAYILDGFEEEWNYTDANHRWATYTNLSAGEYTFMVKAANNDGLWNEDPAKLKIIIVPPFWKTWWFKLLVGITVIAVAIGMYYSRMQSIRRRNKDLEDTVNKRTLEISDKSEEITAQKEELEHHRNKLESLVKERTASLEAALEKAKESDELKSAFLANMSHEIRTPMNAISGFANLLNEKGLTQRDRDEYNEIIQSNSDDLLKIIDEILDMSLIESNQLKLKKETFDLNFVIDHIYSYYLNNKNLNVEVRKINMLESANLKFNSDSVRFKQIITNMMDNAIKYTEKGYIELGTKKDKQNIYIYVKDTGRGIPSEKIDDIFQQFNKIEDEGSKWTRGLGLGLAISQNIADALGGKITVKSELGKGSTFTLGVPAIKILTKKEVIVQEIRESVTANWQGKTILIAEDVEANYLFLNKILKKTQADIIWAKNGEEAFKMTVEESQIDLILMDVKMPVINGYEAAKMIKEQNPKQIIIAQTAYARAEEKLDYFDNNFDEYISKPINPAYLIRTLDKFL